MMKYFKCKTTGEVYAYDQADIDTVNSIASIENALSKAQDALASLTAPPEFAPEYDEDGNQTNADEYKAEREEYERAKQAVADAEDALAGIDEVFFNIRENLKRCALMTDEEVEEHLNPPKTEEQLKAEAESLAASLRYKADAELVPLQDAIDLDMATDDELARAKELKRFRALLSRWSYPEEMPEYPSA